MQQNPFSWRKKQWESYLQLEKAWGFFTFKKSLNISHWVSYHVQYKCSSKTDPSHRKLVLCFQEWKDVRQQILTLKIRFWTKRLTHQYLWVYLLRSSRTAQLSPWCAFQSKYSLLGSAVTFLPLSFCPSNNVFRGVLFPHWPQVIHPQGLVRAFPEEPGGHRLQSGEHSRICGVCDTFRTRGHQGSAPHRAHRHWHHNTTLSCPQNNHKCPGTAVLLWIPRLSSVSTMGICKSALISCPYWESWVVEEKVQFNFL